MGYVADIKDGQLPFPSSSNTVVVVVVVIVVLLLIVLLIAAVVFKMEKDKKGKKFKEECQYENLFFVDSSKSR